jgi:hypothetical protein
MGRKDNVKIKSNLKRCPLLKITKRVINKEDGVEEVYEEFNDCYKTFCMAWDDTTKSCIYFPPEEEEEEEDEDEED